MITLHYLADSRAHRILWMLEEMGTPYKLEVYRRHPRTNLAPRELRAIHPLGKSPVITDDAGENGEIMVAESGAIIEYLAEVAGEGALIPTDPAARREYRYWLHYGEGSLAPLLVMKFIFSKVKEATPWPLRPVVMLGPNAIGKAYLDRAITTHLDFVEQHLAGRAWFAGDALSGADIQMIFPLETSLQRASGEYPNIRAWVAAMHARPAYQRALAAVPIPYAYA